MNNPQRILIEYVDPETISVLSPADETDYISPLIDALNDGLIKNPGVYDVDIINTDGRYTFEVISK